MAKDDERPQFNPKHRIAGAIILVSLAVIFVPMMLDESTPPAENQSLTQIPPRDATPTETKVVVTPIAPPGELATRPAAAAEPAPEKPTADTSPPAPAPVESAKPDTQSKPTSIAAAEKKPEAAAKPRPVAAKPNDVAEKISKGWLVQVGTFANSENADRLREKLKGHGFTVNSETVTVQGSKAVRLRVGPYRDKPTATKAQAQLQKELNIQGMVLASP
jgi:DedD protein